MLYEVITQCNAENKEGPCHRTRDQVFYAGFTVKGVIPADGYQDIKGDGKKLQAQKKISQLTAPAARTMPRAAKRRMP